MKASSNLSNKTSRRRFTKSMATAFLAAPAIASLSSCAEKPPATNQQAAISSTPAPASAKAQADPNDPKQCVTADTTEKLTAEIKNHQPPIIIDGASVKIEMPYESPGEDDDPNEPGGLRYKLWLSQSLTHLGVVQAFADGERGVFRTDAPFLQPGSKLLIWIQEQMNNGEYTPMSTPDLRVVGRVNSMPAMVETKRRFKDKYRKTDKPHRPHRYMHPDSHNENKYIRIGKWEIRDANNVLVAGRTVGDLNYTDFRLMLHFNHLNAKG